ncbi:MAG: serine hydrolase domain-containing protein [Myxococcota bacterium]|nr:serine hydrolase domain-containing protein [Myxococcota bacterium]
MLDALLQEVEGPTAVGLLSGGRLLRASRSCEGDRVFQVGSLSKAVTAMAAARLCERGDIGLDEPIRRWLPRLDLAEADVAEAVTLRHLLLHRGGWEGDYYRDFGPTATALGDYVSSLADLPQVAPLDHAFSYSNSGFGLVGHLVAEIRGCSFEQSVEDLVLAPLGMHRSGYPPAGEGPEDLFRSAHPGGGLRSTVGDLLRFAEAQLRGELEWLQAPEYVGGGLADAMALGWMVDNFSGTRVVRLGGAVGTGAGLVALVPDLGLGLVALGTSLSDLGELMGRLFRVEFGLVQEEPKAFPAEGGSLVPYTGCWRTALDDYRLCAEGDHLQMVRTSRGAYPNPEVPGGHRHPALQLHRIGPDAFRAASGQRGDFVRRPSGEIGWFRWEGRLCRPLDEGQRAALVPSAQPG